MESNNYGHEHPLVLLKENRLICHRIRSWCNRCGSRASAPCFSCAGGCWFYVDKVCAEAPLELSHPFHFQHPLLLKIEESYQVESNLCNYCGERCPRSFYHCSCGLAFHIKCALFTFNIAQNNFKELGYDPSISTENEDEDDKYDNCFRCWEPLADCPYFFHDGVFCLHKKCTEFPLKMNHKCHRKHPLTLQFNDQRFLCAICQIDKPRGFVCGCSPCGLFIHIGCSSLPRTIEDKSHPHPFTLLLRQAPFICDACGTSGSIAAYSCGPCDILVHKECISLPRFIKSKWHDHRISHTYFLQRECVEILDCVICHEEVKAEHGSYACSKCNDLFHVNCVTKDVTSYVIVEDEEEPLDISVNSLIVLEWNDAGEAIVAEHFKHDHPLRLGDRVSEDENKCCDGCLLPISTSFYYCSRCEFYLHKVCAELPKVKYVWHHRCPKPLVLTSDKGFRCVKCGHHSWAFSYRCEECYDYTCLQCVVALTPGARTCLAHKHKPLLFYKDYTGRCNACGGDGISGMFRCKDCSISLDLKCFSLPNAIRHKCDEHLLSLNEHDENSYSESHFCDICEGTRDPNLWFYHCARCDTTTHVDCVLGEYPFVKLGSINKVVEHEHPVTCVRRLYYYPNCDNCRKPCLDLALECAEPGCNFNHHFRCPF